LTIQPRRLPRAAAAAAALVLGMCSFGVLSSADAADYPPSGVTCSISPDPAPQDGDVALTCTGYAVGSTVDISAVNNAKITNPTATPQPIPSGSGAAVPHARPYAARPYAARPHATPPPGGGPGQPGVFTVMEKTINPGSASYRTVGYDALGQSVTRDLQTTVIDTSSTSTQRACTDTKASISPSTIEVGESATMSGTGMKPNTTVRLSDSAGHNLGSTTANGKGAWSATVSPSAPGAYIIYATGAATGACTKRTSTADLTVVKVSGSTLPFTGGDGITTMLIVGAGLVAAGSGVLAAQRRRRLISAARAT
jgi:LPXTG-motif cell wall-anchored protein